MNTPNYPISETDFPLVRDYIQRKLTQRPGWLNQWQGEQSWGAAKNDRHHLQQWCQQWVDEGQWRLLQQAIRSTHKRRQAARQRDPKRVTVTLSGTAWRIVSSLAEKDELSLSDWLIARHRFEWRHR